MAKICVECGAELSFRNEFVYEGQPICRTCLGKHRPDLTSDPAGHGGFRAPTLLRAIAVLNLVGGAGLGLYFLAESSKLGPASGVMGIAFLLEGFFGFVFLLVVAGIARDVRTILSRLPNRVIH